MNLLKVIRKENLEETIRLLDSGADPDSAEKVDGYTGLHWCSQLNLTDIMRALLSAGASVDRLDDDGFTPVMVAVNNGNEEAAIVLLEKGANPLQRREGFTLLHAAAASGTVHFMEKLLSTNKAQQLVNSLDCGGRPPIHWAVQENYLPIVKLLLIYGADPNIPCQDGFSSLSIAASEGFAEIAELLMLHNADASPAIALCKQNPLVSAVAWEREEMVKLLLAHGAEAKVVDEEGMSVVDYAKQTGTKKILEMVCSAIELNE